MPTARRRPPYDRDYSVPQPQPPRRRDFATKLPRSADTLLREARLLIADLQRERRDMARDIRALERELDARDDVIAELREHLLDADIEIDDVLRDQQKPAAGVPTPWDVLGITPSADPAVAKAAYRVLAERHHPDRGGDAKRMTTINDAWAAVEIALEARKGVS